MEINSRDTGNNVLDTRNDVASEWYRFLLQVLRPRSEEDEGDNEDDDHDDDVFLVLFLFFILYNSKFHPATISGSPGDCSPTCK